MALYDPEALRAFYNAYGQREWQRLETPIGRVHLHVTRRFVERQVADGACVLDAGCGPGRFALDLLARGCRVTLVDLSDAMLAEAGRRIGGAGLAAQVEGTHRCSLLDLGFLPPARFAAVLCLGGPLNYMPERVGEALAGFRRLLRPGGALVCGVMNTQGTFRSVLGQGWKPSDDALDAASVLEVWRTGTLRVGGRWISEHRARMFSRQEWRAALADAGFTCVAESASECLLSLPSERLQELEGDASTWPALLEAEVEACACCPEAGAHMLTAAVADG